ncbi:LysR family transcriptional regulator [Bradyrhizobium manausense]|uniref:LysR family transcriptional regulator n=1 Tax=Bradyrhizobium manausense TaxID=989370 RepID=UPI001BA5EB83|nr:LysR family transcriptional regulator [Bradyrhizobium manausense]MBR1091471.1 LysR family transcriptional regulator [Bradyrhizobium manausense]
MDIDKNNIRRLDFSLLLIFDELVRHKRTTVVADRLGLSQSAVSHALTRLRDLFDDPLFSRRPDGLTPTRRALELAPKVRELMQRAQEVVGGAAAFDPAVSDRQFRLAANDFVATSIGPLLLEKLATEAPATRLVSRFAVGQAAFEALRKHELDLAIGRFYEIPDEFETDILLQESFSVIARHRHPRLAETLDLATYLDVDHLLVSFQGRLAGVVDETLARQGLKRRVRASVPMFLTAFAAVAGSDLVATVPARLAQRFAPVFGLRVLPPPLDIDSFPVSLVRLAATKSDPGLAWLVSRVRQIADALG